MISALNSGVNDRRRRGCFRSMVSMMNILPPGAEPLMVNVRQTGGSPDSVENLAVIDLEVCWSLSGQLRQGTQTLPPGTSIGQVRRA